MIRSVSNSQEEIINSALILHNSGQDLQCDITYSTGGFYKSGEVKDPYLKYDKYPQTPDTQPLEAFFSLENGQLQSIICDLPFVIGKGPSLQQDVKGQNITHKRFNSFENPGDLYKCYYEILVECYNKLGKGGVLIFKCQDQVSGGKQYLIHNYVINKAAEAGFYPKDLFILLAKSRLMSGKWKRQLHARKFHSYFLVFQKKQKL